MRENRYSQYAIPDPDWDAAFSGLFGELDVRTIAARGIAWEAVESERTHDSEPCHCPLCSGGARCVVAEKCVALERAAAPGRKPRSVRSVEERTAQAAERAERARVREAVRQNAIAERGRIEYEREKVQAIRRAAKLRECPPGWREVHSRFFVEGEPARVFEPVECVETSEFRMIRLLFADRLLLLPISGEIGGSSVSEALARVKAAGFLGDCSISLESKGRV